MDKVEIILRFVGFTVEEQGMMSEKELWRKTFSVISLIEDLIGGLAGDAPPPSPTSPQYGGMDDSLGNPFTR